MIKTIHFLAILIFFIRLSSSYQQFDKKYDQNVNLLISSDKNFNIQSADTCNEKYCKETIDHIREYKKKHYRKNAFRLCEYQKEYYKINSDRIRQYKKDYYQINSDSIRQRKKQRRLEKKDMETLSFLSNDLDDILKSFSTDTLFHKEQGQIMLMPDDVCFIVEHQPDNP